MKLLMNDVLEMKTPDKCLQNCQHLQTIPLPRLVTGSEMSRGSSQVETCKRIVGERARGGMPKRARRCSEAPPSREINRLPLGC
jgi:hypothetical protein